MPQPFARTAAAIGDGSRRPAAPSRDQPPAPPPAANASAAHARQAASDGRGPAGRAAALARCTDFACLRAAHQLPAPAGAFNFPHFFLLGFPKVRGRLVLGLRLLRRVVDGAGSGASVVLRQQGMAPCLPASLQAV